MNEDFEHVPSSDDGIPTIIFEWGTIREIGGGIDLIKFGNLATVPLPASGVLLLAGLDALGLRRRKRA